MDDSSGSLSVLEWSRIGERFHAMTLRGFDFPLTAYRLEFDLIGPKFDGVNIPELVESHIGGRPLCDFVCNGDQWDLSTEKKWWQGIDCNADWSGTEFPQFRTLANEAGRLLALLPDSLAADLWRDHPRPRPPVSPTSATPNGLLVWVNSLVLLATSETAGNAISNSVACFAPSRTAPPALWLTIRQQISHPQYVFARGIRRVPFWFAEFQTFVAASVSAANWVVLALQGKATERDAKPTEDPEKPNQQIWHESDETNPAEFPYGPLTGQKLELVKWILPTASDPRPLDTFLKDGKGWGRTNHRTSSSVWFRSQKKYAECNQRKLTGSRQTTD